MRHHLFRITIGTILLLVSLPGATMATVATPEADTHFRVITCPFTLPAPEREGETYECGVVAVPLDHADADGPSIELTFARLFATGTNVADDPVLWLEGGPGASALVVAETNRLISAGARESRDIVLFDQRGAGYSDYLECGEYQSSATTGAASSGTPFPEPPGAEASVADVYAYAQATAALGFAECRDAYAARGNDLAHYTTEAIARDSVLLLDALGYGQATLWATSYGGRVATVIMRNAPERVRAAVLDSPLPLGIRRLASFATLETEPAANLFAWCAGDSACASAYPDLEARTLALIDTLNTVPLPIDQQAGFRAGLMEGFDGSGVVRMLTAVLAGNPDVARAIPRAVADLEAGDPTVALAILSGDFPPPVERPISTSLTNTSFTTLLKPTDARLALSLAMRSAVLCNDESDVTLADISAEEANGAATPLRGVVPVRSAVTLYAQCRALDTGAPPLDMTQPTASIPVLVLGGSYDGTTAPSWGEAAANALPNAQFLLVPGAGHATARWSECARTLITGFIGDPDAGIDAGCLESEHPELVGPVDPVATPEPST
ncbi:MAG: alpha/beta fold hydrolase [Thermomicrobiales bacterium]|nr:alpha/beta fold hydrolase [Thermomicrobiales bacterium]